MQTLFPTSRSIKNYASFAKKKKKRWLDLGNIGKGSLLQRLEVPGFSLNDWND